AAENAAWMGPPAPRRDMAMHPSHQNPSRDSLGMINSSGFFAADRYIRTRFLLLFLCDVPITTAALFGAMRWQLPLAPVIVAVAVCIAFATFIILRNARKRASDYAGLSPTSLDDATRRKLRGRIRRLQIGLAFCALVLVYGLWETRGDPLLPRLVGVSI